MTTEPVQPAKRRPGRPPLNRSVGQTRNEPAKVKAAPPTSHPHAAASRPGRPRGSGLASRGTRGRGSSNGNALVTGATRGRPRSSKDSHPIKNPIKSAGRYPAKATTARKAKSKDAGARMNGACTDSDEEPLSSRRASLLPAFEIHKRHVIDQRKQRLGQILDSYDSRVREMYYLENQLPLLEYDPAKLKVDKGERIAKYLQNVDLRSNVANDLAEIRSKAIRDAQRPDRYGTRGHTNRDSTSLHYLVEETAVEIDGLVPRSALLHIGGARYRNLGEYLATFLYLDDEEVSKNDYESRANTEVQVDIRLAKMKQIGLLRGLTAQDLEKRPDPPQRTHWTRLLEEMRVVSAGFAHAGKERTRRTKLASKAMQKYWELRLTEGERKTSAEEKKWKRCFKDVRVELTKRWKLVESIIRIQHSKLLAEEQRQAGKRQLDAIIEHSSTVLQGRNVPGSRASSPSFSVGSSATFDHDGDDFSVRSTDDVDDEIMSESSSDQSEMEALRVEMDVPVEDLLGKEYFEYQMNQSEQDEDSDRIEEVYDDDAGELQEELDDDDEPAAQPDGIYAEDAGSDIPALSIPPSPASFVGSVAANDLQSSGSPPAVLKQRIPIENGDVEFVLEAADMDIDEEDQAAEAELDADEAEEGVDSDEEMNGLRDDMDTDIDALRAWMRQMEEQNGASDDEDQTEDDDGVEEDDNVDADEPIENLEANTSKPFASPRKHTLPDTNHFELENESSGLPEEKAIMGDDPVPHSPFSLSSGASHPEDDDTNAAFQSPPPNANLGTTSLTSISTSAEVDGNLGHDAAKSERDNEAQNQNETPIPFLLKHTLREYQHVGLSWLAGLYQKGLNGILADEMGLGKTIQTISLFAHLAVDRGVWGPHLIVVPTSVMLNWECEFKKWLPGFKLLTYYGNIAERAAKRVGWLKPNSFHVCITSYQIVLRDQHIFRRKRWCYLVLDEAHNIKNFRSQRWQTLLGFNTERRLLLTGTPLQNSLMELWSLLYFLMPAAGGPGGQTEGGFAGRQEFKEWFEGSVSSLIGDGSGMPNDALTTDSADADTRESVARLHAVLRPYILRRLKADVEKQMPAKYEHVVTCRLSKRQRFLYDDFMSRAKTKADLASGNYLSIVNVLMQLRKVCNHPNLFEERPVVTGFALPEGGVPGRLLKLEEILVWKKLLREIDSVVSMARIGLDIVNPDREGPHGWTRLESQRLTKWAAWREIQQSLDEAVDAEVQTRALLPKDGQVRTLAAWKLVKQWHNAKDKVHWWQTLKRSNRLRCRHALAGIAPMYGRDVIRLCRSLGEREVEVIVHASDDPSRMGSYSTYLRQAVLTPEERLATVIEYIDRFVCVTPRARVHPFRTNIPTPGLIYPRSADSYDAGDDGVIPSIAEQLGEVCPVDVLGFAKTRLEISFPDKRLVQFDCGKLQMLDKILKEMKPGGHRALIFTQMTKMLDILEVFLNLHGHRYLRLDGSTKVEQRQVLMERFNNDKRILVFILSTRSGGIGMNLTGADRVIFYDSDWNPAMDAQAQDRAHRIGQTREVHIYRFVSAHTIEENMLRKANQKRRLDQLVIRAGDFTTEWISKNNSNTTLQWQDWLDAGNLTESGDGTQSGPELQPKQIRPETAAGAPADASVWEQAIMQAEDETDVAAAKMATMEFQQDIADFSESGTVPAPSTTLAATGAALERHARTLAKNGGKSSSAVTEPAATSSDPIDRSEISGRETGSPSPSPVVDSASSTPLKPPIPEPGPLDEYLFRLQLYRMNLEHLFDWRDFADELNRVAQEVLQREQAERNAQEELNNRMNGVLGCTVEL